MSRDRVFTKGSEFREISDRDLYYDLELEIVDKEEEEVNGDGSVILYLFFISLLLQYFFGVSQLFTLGAIILYGILQQYFTRVFKTRHKIVSLGIILLANIVDHVAAGIMVLPGSLTNDQISGLGWVLEILWILFYGVEFLSIFAPIQQRMTPGRTVRPATDNARRNFKGLANRVKGSDYNLTDFEEEVDTSLLQTTFREIVKYLIGTFLVIVVLDILIWEIVSIISGGNNIEEAYFVSGISFIIYVGIMIYSGTFFRDEKSSSKSL